MTKQGTSGKAKPLRIAVNVMRSRLTVIGFNIAIVSFQIGKLYRAVGGISIAGVDHPVHVVADVELYMALALSLISLIAFIMSCEFDEVGTCTSWTLIAGDVLMYLALAYTIAGFFEPLGEAIRNVTAHLPEQSAQTLILQKSVLMAGGLAWFLAMYCGPLVSLKRSPFPRVTNLALGMCYFIVVLILSWVNAQAAIVEAAGPGSNATATGLILKELVQPLQW